MDTVLAANSESFRTQLVHHVCAQLMLTDDSLRLDFTKVDSLPSPPSHEDLTLKVRSPYRLRFSSDSIKVVSDASADEEKRYQYTINLRRIPGRKESDLKFSPQS
jgi:hypothetical protein